MCQYRLRRGARKHPQYVAHNLYKAGEPPTIPLDHLLTLKVHQFLFSHLEENNGPTKTLCAPVLSVDFGVILAFPPEQSFSQEFRRTRVGGQRRLGWGNPSYVRVSGLFSAPFSLCPRQDKGGQNSGELFCCILGPVMLVANPQPLF